MTLKEWEIRHKKTVIIAGKTAVYYGNDSVNRGLNQDLALSELRRLSDYKVDAHCGSLVWLSQRNTLRLVNKESRS